MTQEFDVAVVGLGAMGAHAIAELARRGLRVIGLERFGPFHARGSSHGDSRIIRLAYFEDPAYVPLLRRAYEAWREIEARSGEDLLTITGALEIGLPDSEIVSGVMRSVREHGLRVDTMTAEEAMLRFPAFHLSRDEVAVLEPDGGFLRPERAIAAALKLAGADGAVLHFNERVLGFDADGAGLMVSTDAGRYRTQRVVVAAGSYVAGLIPELSGIADPIKQVVGWFAPIDRQATALGTMPVFLSDEGEGGSYFGFPALGAQGVKIGKHGHFRKSIDPEADNPPVNEADRKVMTEFIRHRIPGAAGRLNEAITCRYTLLPSDDFLIDSLPSDPRIIVASPCSGHGFKFASVIGEILADLVQHGETALPIAPFSFSAMHKRIGTARDLVGE